MTAHSLSPAARQRLRAIAAVTAAMVVMAAAITAYGLVIWATGGNMTVAICGAVVLTAALLTVTGRAI